MTVLSFWSWLVNLLMVGGPAVAAGFVLFKWFAPKYIEHRLNIGLEGIKAEHQKELEALKSEQQKELERLRHRLSSRISKIHEKEFDVLPKAWLMLNDLHGSVALALDLTFKKYPNFLTLAEDQFEEFLTVDLGNRLSETQKHGLRNASDRQAYFADAMAGIYLDDAKESRGPSTIS